MILTAGDSMSHVPRMLPLYKPKQSALHDTRTYTRLSKWHAHTAERTAATRGQFAIFYFYHYHDV